MLPRELSDISRGSLTAEEVAYMTEALTRHHGERVAPVSAYCRAFQEWRTAIGAKLERIDAGEEKDYLAEQWRGVVNALDSLYLPILKSNLLARLVYGGEKLRLRPCPEHEGRWSGCHWEIPCGCGSGSNVTGWLADSPEDEHSHVGGPIPVVVR